MTVVRLGEQEPQPRRSLLRRRVTPGIFLAVLVGIVAFRLWVLETAFVDGNSMEPTLRPGDGVLVIKPMAVKRLDLVVFTDPESGDTAIKRVVGMPGETVSIVPKTTRVGGLDVPTGGQVYINGIPATEPYATSSLPEVLPPVTVPQGHYFLMGDNRDASEDSRQYGPVPRERIHGVGVAIIYPLNRTRRLPRSEAAPVGQ